MSTSAETGDIRCQNCGGRLVRTQAEPGDVRTLKCEDCEKLTHEVAGTVHGQPAAAVARGRP